MNFVKWWNDRPCKYIKKYTVHIYIYNFNKYVVLNPIDFNFLTEKRRPSFAAHHADDDLVHSALQYGSAAGRLTCCQSNPRKQVVARIDHKQLVAEFQAAKY